jgi:hypothetical protein
MPKELLSLSEDVLQTRMTFLSDLASKPTHKEKKGQVKTIHPGITNSKLKTRLHSPLVQQFQVLLPAPHLP